LQAEGDSIMWWQSLLNTLRPRTAPKRRASRRLTVEALEGRDVPSYLVTDLGVTAGFSTSYASAVNNPGDVAGVEHNSTGVAHAFVWHDGVMTDLGTLGGPSSWAYGLNDFGQVVGQAETAALDPYGNHIAHAFLWQNGVMTDLGTLGGDFSEARDINNAGQVVGQSQIMGANGYPVWHAVRWSGGAMTDLGTLGGANSWADGINNLGQIVGGSQLSTGVRSSFIWKNGVMTAIGPTGSNGVDGASAVDINDSGQVLGWHAYGVLETFWYINEEGETVYYQQIVAVRQGFVWEAGSVSLIGAYGVDTYVDGMNADGQVVGYNSGPAGNAPFLWKNGVMTDITNEVPTGFSPSLLHAINDAGQLVGSTAGQAELLTPIAPPPTISVNNVSVTEGNSGTRNAVFTVNLSAASAVPVTVQYATVDGTATAGSDYVATSGVLTFAPGETSKTIAVPVIGDRLAEPNETFFVNLSGAANATLANGQGVGTILDDEPRISISDVRKKEGKQGQTTLFVFTVTLSAAYDQPVTLSFQTADGTATVRDSDYVAQASTQTFNPGETTKTLTIVVNGDGKKEADETFFVDLFGNSSNALISKSRGIGTILNDD
jgi:probable HAF family extracellular repeat protein